MNRDETKMTNRIENQSVLKNRRGRIQFAIPVILATLLSMGAAGTDAAEYRVFGTCFGNDGGSLGKEFYRATDGDPTTFFESASASNAFTGVSSGGTGIGASIPQRLIKIRFFPKTGSEDKMLGGKFQASTGETGQLHGDHFMDLATLSAKPAPGWNEILISDTVSYRHFRYLSAPNGNVRMAEMEFISDVPGLAKKGLDTTDADAYVNRFIRTTAEQGNKQVVGGGSWWGPINRFFDNQLWSIIKNGQSGSVFTPNSKVTIEMTALMPGKIPGKGHVINTLSYPQLAFNFCNQTPDLLPSNIDNLEKWHQLSRPARSPDGADGSCELRPRAIAFETLDNPWNDPAGSPSFKGDTARAQPGFMSWFGDKVEEPGREQTHTADHLGLKWFRQDIIDAHGWYGKDVEYAYAVMENASDVAGKTVSGIIQIRGWAQACKNPNCPHDDAFPIAIHHHAIKIEQDDKDFWVTSHQHTPMDVPLAGELRQKSLTAFTLDTRQLTNGWHILSYHTHVIDARTTPGLKDKQLAAELKIPIFVNNPEAVSVLPHRAPRLEGSELSVVTLNSGEISIRYRLLAEEKNSAFGLHKLAVYSSSGNLIKSLSLSRLSGTLIWDGSDDFRRPVSPGVYFFRLSQDNRESVTKAILGQTGKRAGK